MSIRVVDEQPVIKVITWKDAKIGHIYQSGELVAIRTEKADSREAFATCLRSGQGVNVGRVWVPGENSSWTPVNMDASIAPVVTQ